MAGVLTARRLFLRALASAIFLMGRASIAASSCFSASSSSRVRTGGGLRHDHPHAQSQHSPIGAWSYRRDDQLIRSADLMCGQYAYATRCK